MSHQFDERTKGTAKSVTRAALKEFGLGLLLASSLAATQVAKAASFVVTGEMIAPRDFHTSTLLANGKVLITGGSDYDAVTGGGVLSNSELYDPATGEWASTGALGTGREIHTATLLSIGNVLVAGGVNDNGDPLSQVEIYSPLSGTWTSTGSLNTGRIWHTATVLANGKVLVAGGYGPVEPLSSAELYDPAAGTWTVTGSMAGTRYNHTATLLTNGLVLVTGGNDGANVLSTAELYNPASGTWMATGPMSTEREVHTATLLPNGKLLVAGGENNSFESLASAELYDPIGGTWSNTGSMRIAPPTVDGRVYHAATLLANGKVLVAGGVSLGGGFGFARFIVDAEIYDPATQSWTAAGALNAVRGAPTATLLPSGRVLIAGGSYYYPLDPRTHFPYDAELYVGTLTLTNPITLTNPTQLSNGSFQFSFTSSTGLITSVLATTNLTLPSIDWIVLGSATEISPGQFQFTDNEAVNCPRRFYRVCSP
jgi:hypothetical protein